MWAGARATQGASRGRVCYEVRVDADQSTEHLGAEACPHVLRCGWWVAQRLLHQFYKRKIGIICV